MPRNGSAVDTRTVLKTYNISSTSPKRWQDASLERPRAQKRNPRQNRYSVLVDKGLDDDADASRPTDAAEDEEDPLGVVGGGIFKYPCIELC